MEILVSSTPMELIWTCNGGRTSSPWHIIAAFCFALIFLIARFFLDRLIFRRLAVWLLCNGCVPLKFNKATRAKVAKCAESMWKFTYYTTAQFCILAFVYHEPWFQHTYEFFNGWPDQELKLPVQLYYLCQCGFYLYSIAALLAWETRRKDFAVMMSHHVITVILLAGSYLTRFFQIGTVILILHDTSDIYMEAAKVFKYSDKEFAASALFSCFAVSWVFLRLIFFPLCIIKATSYDICRVLNLEDAYHRFLYYLFNTMLIMLLLFHIYWWVLIYAMIRRQLKNRGQVGEDIRSDSEDEK